MTALKIHQLIVAGLVLTAFVVGSLVGDWVGMAVLVVTAVSLLAASFGRRTWRLIRVMEGAALLPATGLVTAGAAHVGWGFDLAGWALALLVGALTLLDGLFDLGALGAAIQKRLGGSAR